MQLRNSTNNSELRNLTFLEGCQCMLVKNMDGTYIYLPCSRHSGATTELWRQEMMVAVDAVNGS